MSRRSWIVIGLLALALAPASAGARTPHHRSAAQLRPRAFASCPQLVGYARRHFARTHGVAERPVAPLAEPAPQPTGVATPPAAAAPTDGARQPQSTNNYSTTNNQEAGVDEPDIVKTDGTTIFAVNQNAVRAVAVGGAGPRLVGSLDLGSTGYGAQLLLRGGRLIVISGGGPLVGGPLRPTIAPMPYFYGGRTVVTEVDVRDPAAMKITRTMTVDGTFVDARENGSTARLVLSTAPRAIADASMRSRPSGWVPARQFHSALTGRHYVRPVAACSAVRRPVQFSGLGMVTILTLNLDRGLWTADSTALMADAELVYGSQNNLYVATQKWTDPRTPPQRLPSAQTTVIHRFDATNPDRTTYVASGEVPGYLLNQFSLSEYKGFLRTATTSRPIWWGAGPPQALSQSYVTVLAQSGGVLAPVGQVGGLGAGQQIYSVRFLDDRGYVVTFRQVDPLYAIDLSDPIAPRVAGQLELQGFSAYLHPVGPGLLLGIGQDVGPGNLGTQLELFDVSDATAPKLLQRATLGSGSSSAVRYDHHAFLFWPPTGLAVLPVQIYSVRQLQPAPAPGAPVSGGGQDFVGAIGFHVDRAGINEAGRVTHDAVNGFPPPIRRSIVIGERLFTVSDGGVMASSLDALARQAFVPFPAAPAPQPVPLGVAQRKG